MESKGRELAEEIFERKISGRVERKRRCGEGKRRGREGVTRIEEARREPKREEEKERGRRGDKGESSDRREGVSEDYEEVL